MTIRIEDGEFLINGTSSKVVAKALLDGGLQDSVVAEVVGGWFVGVTGATQPAPFAFTTDVQATDPQCAITYDRDFSHVDWIDGESRVQAGMTPEELGFNARFHAIENEFDGVAGQFTQLGKCVVEVRTDLVGVVEELEAKLTTMQNQIHALEQAKKPEDKPSILGTATLDGKDIFITQFQDEFKFVDFSAQPLDRLDLPRPQVFDPVAMGPDDYVELTDGLRRTFTLPEVEALFRTGAPPMVADLRTSPITAVLVLPTGEALGAVLAGLPSDMALASPADAVAAIVDHMVTSLPDEAAGNLRTGLVTGDAADRTGNALLSSGVAGLGLDDVTTRALSQAGLGTVGRLAGADPQAVATALSAAGLDPALAGTLVARAVVARAVRNVGRGGRG